MGKKIVSTEKAPAAIGPYSQAVLLGLDPATGTLAEGAKAQAERACANLKAVLAAAGCAPEDVVKTTIFLADIGDFSKVNEVYAALFDGAFPARSTIQVAGLPKGGLVEIEAVAVPKG